MLKIEKCGSSVRRRMYVSLWKKLDASGSRPGVRGFINRGSGQAMTADARASADICAQNLHESCFLWCYLIVFGRHKSFKCRKSFSFSNHYLCELVALGKKCLEGHRKPGKNFVPLRRDLRSKFAGRVESRG